jgi:hypothetical protein
MVFHFEIQEENILLQKRIFVVWMRQKTTFIGAFLKRIRGRRQKNWG